MKPDAAYLDYSQREMLANNIAQRLSTDFPAGLQELRSHERHASRELDRDLLALAWRFALQSKDPSVRRALVDYLLEAALKGSPFAQGQALRFLQDFSAPDFGEQALKMVDSMPLSGEFASSRIRLLGIASDRSRMPLLRGIAEGGFARAGNDGNYYASAAWAAALVLARFGEDEYLRQIVKRTTDEPDIVVRATILFADLAYTERPAAFDALRFFLHSQNRLPRVKDNIPGDPESVYAARQFSRHIENCPVKGADVYEKDVPAIRAWADAQTTWSILR